MHVPLGWAMLLQMGRYSYWLDAILKPYIPSTQRMPIYTMSCCLFDKGNIALSSSDGDPS